MSHARSRRGFTLIELLVVIAIIAILIALLVPAVQKVRAAADRARCQNNIKQLALACHSFHDAYAHWPRAGYTQNELSWHVYILPYIEQKSLYDQANLAPGGSFNGAPNNTGPGRNELALNNVPVFLCVSSLADKMQTGPNDNQNAPEIMNGVIAYTTHYYGILGPKGTNVATNTPYNVDPAGLAGYGGFSLQGMFQRSRDVRLRDVLDGTSNTLAIGEQSWVDANTGTRYRSWARGCDATPVCGTCRNIDLAINIPAIGIYMDQAMGSMHSFGANFAFADGAVNFISQDISMNVYRSLASRDGGESAVAP